MRPKRAMNACIEMQEERTVCAVQMAERRANLGNVNMRQEPMGAPPGYRACRLVHAPQGFRYRPNLKEQVWRRL